jgi:hypothetical protein
LKRDRGISAGTVLSVLLAAVIFISVLGFVKDIVNTQDYGGVDLRNRVVGARVMLEGLDPYHFKWSESYPDTLLDPVDNPDNEVSRVTVPPTVLMLHVPLARLPYHAQRTIWLYGQWLLLLASIFLLALCAKTRNQAKSIWIIGLFFSCTGIWRFHVERGQVYILFVFLAALALWLCRRPWKYAALWGGIALGITASMRPTLALMLLPMLAFRKWKLSAGLAAGLVIFVLLSVAIFGVPLWKDYSSAMRYHERDNLGLAQPISEDNATRYIEGTGYYGSYKEFPDINTSLQWFLKYNWDLNAKAQALSMMLAFVLLLAAAYLILFWKRDVSLETTFLAGFSIMLVAEFFLPAVKTYYFNIMWLVPLSLLAISVEEIGSIPRWQVAAGLFLLFTGVLLTFSLFWLDYEAWFGEGLITLSFVWASACLIKASPFIGVSGEALPPVDAAKTSAGEAEPGLEAIEPSDTGGPGGGEST